MEFWELAYTRKWVTKENLKKVVGVEITEEEYKEITGEDFTA